MDRPSKAFELEWVDRSGMLRAKATLIEVRDREYRLLKGALCVKRETPALPESGRRRRAEARDEGVLVASQSHPECLELIEDRVFKSVSGAAVFVLGMSAQGSAWWTPVSESNAASRDDSLAEAAINEKRLVVEMERFLTARPGFEGVMQDFLGLVNKMLKSDEWSPPCSVTSRIKSPESLMRKMMKEKDGAEGQVRSLEQVSDVIGVRVIFYSRDDVDEFNHRLELLRSVIQGNDLQLGTDAEDGDQALRLAWVDNIRHVLPTGDRNIVLTSDEVRDDRTKDASDQGDLRRSYYVARHWDWEYSDTLTVRSQDARLVDIRAMPYACELQVVYVFDHVVNEVLHDLIYKDATPGRSEDRALRVNFDWLKSNLDAAESTLQGRIIDYLAMAPPDGTSEGSS